MIGITPSRSVYLPVAYFCEGVPSGEGEVDDARAVGGLWVVGEDAGLVEEGHAVFFDIGENVRGRRFAVAD